MHELICKLNELRNLDTELATFGAAVHRYELNPPLSEAEVAAVESTYRCRFPDDYRRFLTTVGNGGAGPAYGIFPLEMHDDDHDLGPWDGGHLIGDLAQPFPFIAAWNLPAEFWEQEPDSDQGTIEEQDRESEEWEAKLEKEYWAEEIVNGAIPVCHEGCALRIWLVVTGPLSGTVWKDGRADQAGIAPLLDEEGRYLSFHAWYLNWLQSSIDKLTVAGGRASTASITFPAILISQAGWLKSGESIGELSDASPSDDLADWQGLSIVDAGGKCFRARRVFREWPKSRLGAFLCRIANHSIQVGMELEQVDAPKLSELVSRIASITSLPADAEWASQRQLVEFVND